MIYSGIHMSEMDLIELYQLLSLYRRTYQEDGKKTPAELLKDIGDIYGKISGGKDIGEARNPRGAGRKRIYSGEMNKKIKDLYGSNRSMRKTAREAGCSLGHVQDVVSQKGSKGHGCMEIN